MLFLQGLSNADAISPEMAAGISALVAAFFVVFLIVGIILYVYLSFAFMAIGKKARLQSPGLAWIPFVGPGIIAYQASKMHWWPWLLIIGFFIPFVNIVANIAFAVYMVIWQWKMFEVINKPGWWAILCLIPGVNLVMYGVAAWSK